MQPHSSKRYGLFVVSGLLAGLASCALATAWLRSGWAEVPPPNIVETRARCQQWEVPGGETVQIHRRTNPPEWHTVDLSGGRVRGWDKGEFGGGLWLTGTDGEPRLLDGLNVVHLVRIADDSALVFSGISHLGEGPGIIMHVRAAADGKPEVLRLHKFPHAIAQVQVTSRGWLAVLDNNTAFHVGRSFRLSLAKCRDPRARSAVEPD